MADHLLELGVKAPGNGGRSFRSRLAALLQRESGASAVPDGAKLLAGVLVAALLALVAAIFGVLLIATFRPGLALPFDAVPLLLDNYRIVFAEAATYRLLGNTLVYALGATLLGSVIGAALAYLIERTDLPYAQLIHVIVLSSMALPSLFVAFGWILLLDPRIGALNLWLRGLLGSTERVGPFTIFTAAGMIFVTGLAIAPTFYLMLSTLFRRMDASMEEAAATSGAPTGQVLARVTGPLLMPGLASVFVYGMLILVQTFEIPLAMGLNAGFPVLSIRIFLLTQPDPSLPSYGLAATYSLLAMIIGLGLMAAYFRAVRSSDRFQVITGKGYRPRRISLGRWALPVLAAVCVYVLLKVVWPFLILLWASLSPTQTYRPPTLEALGNLSLASYARLLTYPQFGDAIVNTLVVVVATSSLGMLLSTLMAHVSVRSRGGAGKALDVVAFLTSAIPGVVIALAILVLFVRTPLYGTTWIIALAMMIGGLGFATRLMVPAVIQIHGDLEEAAKVSGATPTNVFLRIVLPLLLPAFMNGWFWLAAHNIRDFTYPLMLAGTHNVLLATLLWSLWGRPTELPTAAALVMVITVLLMMMGMASRGLSHQSRGISA